MRNLGDLRVGVWLMTSIIWVYRDVGTVKWTPGKLDRLYWFVVGTIGEFMFEIWTGIGETGNMDFTMCSSRWFVRKVGKWSRVGIDYWCQKDHDSR